MKFKAKKTIEEINETNNWFFKKIDKNSSFSSHTNQKNTNYQYQEEKRKYHGITRH